MTAAAAALRRQAVRGTGSACARAPAVNTKAPQSRSGFDRRWRDKESWRAAKEGRCARVKHGVEGAGPCAPRTSSRRAREEAQRARRQAKEAQDRAREQAQEEVQRIARRVQEQVQDHFARGDWPTGVREGLTELAKEFGEFGKDYGKEFGKDFGFGRGAARSEKERERFDKARGHGAHARSALHTPEDFPAEHEPVLGPRGLHRNSPARDLDRLLDRFRDDIRDAARDHGITAAPAPRRPPPPVDGGGPHRSTAADTEGVTAPHSGGTTAPAPPATPYRRSGQPSRTRSPCRTGRSAGLGLSPAVAALAAVEDPLDRLIGHAVIGEHLS